MPITTAFDPCSRGRQQPLIALSKLVTDQPVDRKYGALLIARLKRAIVRFRQCRTFTGNGVNDRIWSRAAGLADGLHLMMEFRPLNGIIGTMADRRL